MTEPQEKTKEFIRDVLALYEKHGLSISCEETHGSLVIEKNSEWNREWLKAAHESLHADATFCGVTVPWTYARAEWE